MADLAIAFARVGAAGEDPFDLEGDLLDGQFRVGKLVGEGELSVIYRGAHEGFNAPIAIKCLNLPQTLETKLVEPISESFHEGARVHYRLAQGQLDIVQTLALGTTLAPRIGQHIPYVVREWLDGRSLAEDLAARTRDGKTPRTSIQAVELLESAADAIAYAHGEGVCHHSLSPRNLFLAKTRRREILKVLDFGMARDVAIRRAESGEVGLRLLSSHVAPEQLDGRIGAPSAATDVFAFALILFEVVTGREYFAPGAHASEILRVADSRAPLSRHVTGQAVPRDLESVLSRALAPTPGERHTNLRLFWEDVKRAVQRVNVSARLSLSSPPAAAEPTIASPHRSNTAPVQVPPRVRQHTIIEGVAPPQCPPPMIVEALPREAPPVLVEAPPPKAPPIDVEARPPPEATRPSPSSCTAEVAPPVTTYASIPGDEDVAPLQRDTIPDDLRGSTADFGHALVAASNGPDVSSAVVARSPTGARRAAVLASVALACVVTLLLVVFARGVPQPTVGTPNAKVHRTARDVIDTPARLAIAETRLHVKPKPSGFDRAFVKRSFDETASELESCTQGARPRGPGSIRVVIDPSGKIVRLQIGRPYANTMTGECISRRFVATELPAFVGTSRAMNYTFNTIPFKRP